MDKPLPPALVEQLTQLMRAGKKIEAIKLYREATGVGLAEAKQAVEQLESPQRTQSPEIPATPAAKGGCLGVILLVACPMIGGALWWLLR